MKALPTPHHPPHRLRLIAPSAYQARRDESAYLQGSPLWSTLLCPRSGLPGPSIVGAMACPRPGEGLAVRFKRRILATKKLHVQHKSIAVLKNTMQNEAYTKHIQGNMEKLIHNVCDR